MLCNCDRWKFYIKNYSEAFEWYSDEGVTHSKWYFIWTKLTETNGFTQVDRFAIPLTHCPCCGGILQPPNK